MKSPPRYPRRSGHRPDYDVRAVFRAIAKNEATDEEDVKETRPRRRRMRHPGHGKIVESDDELRTSLRDSTTEKEGPEEENDVEDGDDLVSMDWSGILQGALDECEEALGKQSQPSASNNVLPEGEVKLDETKAAELIESDSDEDDHHFEVRTRRDLPREDFRDLVCDKTRLVLSSGLLQCLMNRVTVPRDHARYRSV